MSHRPNSLVLKHPRSALGTAGLRGFDWARPPAATLRVTRPPGRELNGSLPPRLVLTRSHHQPAKRIKKQFGDSAPTARPQKTGAPVGSRLRLEWIAFGFTVQSFWTGTRRWIVSLESKLRLGLTTRLRLTRLSPYRCLAGRPSVRAAKRN
jgi:hypothetical protein